MGDGENVAILSNLAASELKLGEFDAAVVHASAANDLSGGFSAEALFRKGQALEGLGRHAEACESYRAALAIEPNDRTVRQRLQECQKTLEAPKELQVPFGNDWTSVLEEKVRQIAQHAADPQSITVVDRNGGDLGFVWNDGRSPEL